MLNKASVKEMFRVTEEKKIGLTVCAFPVNNVTDVVTWSTLPCYGSIPRAISGKNIDKFVYVFPWAESKGRQLLFQEDSPFTELLDSVYEHSYKDEFSFDQFKIMCLTEGIILEGSLIKDWCSATLMALIMAGRDTLYEAYKPRMAFKNYRKKYSSGTNWFPNLREGINFNSRKIKPIYTRETNNYPVVNRYGGTVEQFFFEKLGEHYSDWTSGTDAVYFLVTGVPVHHESYQRFTNIYSVISDRLYRKHCPYYQKDPELQRTDSQIHKMVLEDEYYVSEANKFNETWKVA